MITTPLKQKSVFATKLLKIKLRGDVVLFICLFNYNFILSYARYVWYKVVDQRQKQLIRGYTVRMPGCVDQKSQCPIALDSFIIKIKCPFINREGHKRSTIRKTTNLVVLSAWLLSYCVLFVIWWELQPRYDFYFISLYNIVLQNRGVTSRQIRLMRCKDVFSKSCSRQMWCSWGRGVVVDWK